MPAQIKITKRTVDRITGDGSDKFYWDDDLPVSACVSAPRGASTMLSNSAPTVGYVA